MEELHAKLEEIIKLYEQKIRDSEAKNWQDQWEHEARNSYRYVIMGLRLALGWVEEYS